MFRGDLQEAAQEFLSLGAPPDTQEIDNLEKEIINNLKPLIDNLDKQAGVSVTLLSHALNQLLQTGQETVVTNA